MRSTPSTTNLKSFARRLVSNASFVISRSSASSSAIKTTIGVLLTILASMILGGQLYNKCRSLAGRTLGCNRASVPLHDFPANRQSDAGTFVLVLAVQPLKHFENTLAVCFL